MKYVHNLSDDKALGIKFYEIVAQQIAQPYWYAWSLTDEEIRNLLEHSKEVSYWLNKSGMASFFSAGSYSAKSISDAMLDISKKGIKKSVKSAFKSVLNMDFGEKISKSAALPAGFVTIMASLLYESSEHDIVRSKDELIRRGIIRVEDEHD